MDEKILRVARLLYDRTDGEHPITSRELHSLLEEEGIQADVRAIHQAVSCLKATGHDITEEASRGTVTTYRVNSRLFDVAELKLLMDAAVASEALGRESTESLLGRLVTLAPERDRQALLAGTDSRGKPEKPGVLCVTDQLYRAIRDGRQISFLMFDYSPKRRRVYKHSGRRYRLSPYALLYVQDRYYVLGWDEEKGRIITPKVDRITGMRILESQVTPPPEDFDLNRYRKKVFRMYTGDDAAVTLECEPDMMNAMVDRFGRDFPLEPLPDGRFRGLVTVSVSPTFFRWVFTYGGSIRIVGPGFVKRQYSEMLRAALAAQGEE